MTPCAVCKDYPAGTACSMTGCPGRTFHIGRAPYRPTDFADWREAVHRRIVDLRLSKQFGVVSIHNGGVTK